MLCYRHHPDYMGKKPTHELIHRLHAEHKKHEAALQDKFNEIHQHLISEASATNDEPRSRILRR